MYFCKQERDGQMNTNGMPPHYPMGRPMMDPQTYHKEHKRLWNLGNGMGLAVVGTFVVSFLLSMLFMALQQLLKLGDTSSMSAFGGGEILDQLTDIILYVPVMLAPFLVFAKLSGYRLSSLTPLGKPKMSLLVPGVMMGLGGCIVGNILTALISSSVGAVGVELSSPSVSTPQTLAGQLLFYTSTALVPALVEEFIFRGVVMQSLRRFGDGFAIVMSSVVFALMHGNLVQAPFALVVGLTIGYLVIITGSMWVGLIIHFLNNLFACILQVVFDNISLELASVISLAYYVTLIALGVVGYIILRSKKAGCYRFYRPNPDMTTGQKLSAFLLNPGMIVSMVAILFVTAQYVHFVGFGG